MNPAEPHTPTTARALRIGNLSTSRGDAAGSIEAVLDGGGLDVLVVDALSDEAVLDLAEERRAGGSGFEQALVDRVAGALDSSAARATRVITNAGGLDPEGFARALAGRGVAEVAWVDSGTPEEAADAAGVEPDGAVFTFRVGAFGVAEALAAGARIVVTGRVSREALVLGAAVAHHGWDRSDLGRLAGAVVAGHVVSGGPGVTGVATSSTDVTRSGTALAAGYPLADVAADGSCLITRHPSALGSVTTGTVVDQLLDGVTGSRYPAPDVVVRLDTVRVEHEGTDRVRISGARGESPRAEVPVVGLRRLPDGAIGRSVHEVRRSAETHVAVLPGGRRVPVAAPVELAGPASPMVPAVRRRRAAASGPVRAVPLRTLAAVRSGVAGDRTVLAVWTWDEDGFAWLAGVLDAERVARLVAGPDAGPEAPALQMSRSELANLRALLFVVRPGHRLPDGAVLAERLAATAIDVPVDLLELDP